MLLVVFILSSGPAVESFTCRDDGSGLRGPQRDPAAIQLAASIAQCPVYSADRFLASDDIIAAVLRCSSKSAHFAPLRPESTSHASRQKIGSPVGWMIEDVMGCVS